MLSAPTLFMVFVKRPQVIFIALNIDLLNFTRYPGWQWWVVKNQAVQCVATAAERWVIVCMLVEVVGQDRRIFRNWFQVTLIEVTSEKEVRLMVEVQSSRWRWNIGITQVLQLSLLIRQRQTKTNKDRQIQTMTNKDRQRKTKTAKGRHGTWITQIFAYRYLLCHYISVDCLDTQISCAQVEEQRLKMFGNTDCGKKNPST